MSICQHTSGAPGHCYGMSTTVILNKVNALNLSSFTATETVRKATLNEFTKSIICYWQVTQNFEGPSASIQKYLSKTTTEKLDLLEEKASAVKNGGSPVLFGFDIAGWGSHAVVAYAVDSGSFTSSASGRRYNHRVSIYDCNVVNWNEDYCLLFNEGTDEWEIPHYTGAISTNSGASLILCTNELSVIDAKDYTEGLFNYVAELQYKNRTKAKLTDNATNQTWTIDGNTGNVAGGTDLIAYHDFGTIESGIMPALNIVLPDEDASYTLVADSGDGKELDFSILYDDKYLSFSSSAAEGATFGVDQTLSLIGNEGDFEITIADDTIPDGEFHTYTLTGDNIGDIVISVVDDGLSITGDDLGGLTITAADDLTSNTLVVKDNVTSVDVERKGSELVVADPGNGTTRFDDVPADAYYYDAVVWAVANDITSGTSATTFSPNDPCTRAQIVTFLWRAAGSPTVNASNPFTDVAKGKYYYDAVLWAVENGITSGTTATTFSPDKECTRAEAVTFLYRAKSSPVASGTNSFTDVASDAWYANAVQWAVNTNVTAGTSSTTFSPNQTCTRAQIVTFLYRDRKG